MGWLLYHCLNRFIPVNLHPPTVRMYFPQDGLAFFTESGVPEDGVLRIIDEHHNLLRGMQRTLLAVFDKDVFDRHEEEILKACSAIGKCSKRGETEPHFQKQLRRYTGLADTDSIIVMTIEIDYNELYYRRRRVKSKRIDRLSKELANVISRRNFYIAPTITESVLLEDMIYSMAANAK